MTRTLTAATLLLTLAACTKVDPPRSVDWYKTHKAERKAMIETCEEQGVPTSLDCVNASKADIAVGAARRGYVKPKPVDFGGGV